MPRCQPGIFDKTLREHLFVEYVLGQQVEAGRLAEVLAGVADLAGDKTQLVLALGPDLWARLPGGFAFPGFALEGLTSTQGDLLLWIQGETRADVVDLMQAAHRRLVTFGSVQLELPGFVYHDFRDLTGFVDGIGNPEGEKARAAALVPTDAEGAAGSFMLTQKWVHQLEAFHALPEGEQERVFGRTKADAVEFDEDKMPPNSHVGRTDDADNKIWRRSVPFASLDEQGLYFVAFSCAQSRFDVLLKRMYGQDEDGIVDRLTHFSTPVMNSYWFAPAQDWFQR